MDSITDILPNFIIDLLPIFILDRINLITFSFLLLICLILWGIIMSKADALSSRDQRIKSLINQINTLNNRINNYKDTISQLNAQITSGNQEYSQLYNQYLEATQGESIESNNQQILSLTQEKNKLKSNINRLKATITQLNKQISSGNERYSILYNQNTTNVQQIDQLGNQIKDLSREIVALKKENNSLKVKNNTNKDDYKKLNLQIKAIQQQNINLQNKYNKAIAAKKEAVKKLEEWKEKAENEGNYNKKHAHPRDKNLTFDENEHKYFVGNKELKSVTSLIEEYFPPFEAERLAYIVGKKTGRNPQELIAEWDRKGEEARTLGTKMHENIEKFYLGEEYENNDIFGQFLDFNKETHLVPYRTEWPIYDEEAGIAGTLDFLDYQNGEYIIYDWKRSKKVVSPKIGKPIVKSKNKTKGLRPITDIEDAPYWHYALQTSLYRYILKRDYGIDVAKSRLVVMHPELKQAFMTDVPYMEKEVIAILEDQKRRQ